MTHAETKEVLRAELASTLYCEPDEIGDGDSFADLGLDSILGVEFIDALNKKFGLANSAEILYEHSTLETLTAFVANQSASDEVTS
ncbi:acyl carrier protein [Streptomyces formicae]|uniref:Acyl carrier protein n=1 Tax=Streptomyces formicae TaxID=1616117 RepID=A0ABY3WQ67_9ACTN|nr:acyl carrier protein [Streptomyces formicae]UNM14789.1 acyl carrier protein [Streptomyces formicae]